MKSLPLKLFFLFMLSSRFSFGQLNEATPSATLDLTGAAGIANYYGDLTENAHLLNQSSYAVTFGACLNLITKFSIRADLSLLKLKADDSKNGRVDLKARNLNFKSNIWEFNLGFGYDINDIISEYKFTPNFNVGVGVFHFNPYTTDRFGSKQFLQPLGTEGQGIAAYPDRKPYKRTEFEWLAGIGFKYAWKPRIIIQMEYRIRYTNTDYIDDVSRYGYPDKNILAQKDPNLPYLTYRGDELPGGSPYPVNSGLNRGHSNKKDVFYTTQLKIAYRLTEFYQR